MMIRNAQQWILDEYADLIDAMEVAFHTGAGGEFKARRGELSQALVDRETALITQRREGVMHAAESVNDLRRARRLL